MRWSIAWFGVVRCNIMDYGSHVTSYTIVRVTSTLLHLWSTYHFKSCFPLPSPIYSIFFILPPSVYSIFSILPPSAYSIFSILPPSVYSIISILPPSVYGIPRRWNIKFNRYSLFHQLQTINFGPVCVNSQYSKCFSVLNELPKCAIVRLEGDWESTICFVLIFVRLILIFRPHHSLSVPHSISLSLSLSLIRWGN